MGVSIVGFFKWFRAGSKNLEPLIGAKDFKNGAVVLRGQHGTQKADVPDVVTKGITLALDWDTAPLF
jgi:hypothetical protein